MVALEGRTDAVLAAFRLGQLLEMHRRNARAHVFAQDVQYRGNDSIGLPKEANLVVVLDEDTAKLLQLTAVP